MNKKQILDESFKVIGFISINIIILNLLIFITFKLQLGWTDWYIYLNIVLGIGNGYYLAKNYDKLLKLKKEYDEQ